MRRIQIPINEGLKFNSRYTVNERLFNLSLAAKQQALINNRIDTVLATLPASARVVTRWEGSVYALLSNGDLTKNFSTIDTGYDAEGNFAFSSSLAVPHVPHLFVASPGKMRKVSQSGTITKWGIDPPTGQLSAALNNIDIVINNCDSTTGWAITGAGGSIATTNDRVEGTAALKVTYAQDIQHTLTFTPGAPIDLSTAKRIRFWINFISPSSINSMVFRISFGDTGFSNNFASHPVFVGAPQKWEDRSFDKEAFAISGIVNWSDARAFRFEWSAQANQDFLLDYIRGEPPGVDDSVGVSYRYRYKNTTTGHVSNLNSTPSTSVKPFGNNVTVSGFVPSSDPQVNEIEVFRNVNNGGTYFFVGSKPNDGNAFVDNKSVSELGNADTNDNAVPPDANLVSSWQRSAVLNDVTNPRRIWFSVPGKFESFEDAGRFDFGEVNDTVVGFGQVAGNFYVWTRGKLWRLRGEYPNISFVPIADVGAISARALMVEFDRAVFAYDIGVLEFDGANISVLPEIWTLFDLNSLDPRTVDQSKEINIGSDDRYIWVQFVSKDGVTRCFEYNSFIKQWTERNTISGFDKVHQTTFPIAGDNLGQIIELYTGPSGRDFVFQSKEVEFDLSGLVGVEIQYSTTLSANISIILDDVVVFSSSLAVGTNLKEMFSTLGNYGERLRIFINGPGGDFELFELNAFLEELPIPVKFFDTGQHLLSRNKTIPNDFILHLFAKTVQELSAQVFIDNVLIETFNFSISNKGPFGPVRMPLPTNDGRTARVILSSTGYFSLFHVSIGTTLLGDDTIKAVEVGGDYISQKQRIQRLQTPLL